MDGGGPSGAAPRMMLSGRLFCTEGKVLARCHNLLCGRRPWTQSAPPRSGGRTKAL